MSVLESTPRNRVSWSSIVNLVYHQPFTSIVKMQQKKKRRKTREKEREREASPAQRPVNHVDSGIINWKSTRLRGQLENQSGLKWLSLVCSCQVTPCFLGIPGLLSYTRRYGLSWTRCKRKQERQREVRPGPTSGIH